MWCHSIPPFWLTASWDAWWLRQPAHVWAAAPPTRSHEAVPLGRRSQGLATLHRRVAAAAPRARKLSRSRDAALCAAVAQLARASPRSPRTWRLPLGRLAESAHSQRRHCRSAFDIGGAPSMRQRLVMRGSPWRFADGAGGLQRLGFRHVALARGRHCASPLLCALPSGVGRAADRSRRGVLAPRRATT